MAIAMQFILPLMVVASLAVAALKIWQRFSGQGTGPGERKLSIVESMSIGTSDRLLVVRFDGQDLLLSCSKSGIHRLCASTADSQE